MEKIELVKKDVPVIADIICDICGNSCKTDVDYEYLKMEARWGYATKKDMEEWTAHVCEKCVDEKLSFIKFKKEDVIFQSTLTTESKMDERLQLYLLKRKD